MATHHRSSEGLAFSLSGRHVFMIFASSAVLLVLTFAVGVTVGKRLGPEVAAKPAADPLTMLDQLGGGTVQVDELTFPEALGKRPGVAKAKPKRKAKLKDIPKPKVNKPASKPLPSGINPPLRKQPKPKTQLAQGNKANAGKQKVVKAAKVSTPGNYTLQLSSFQDRSEAELFMNKLRSAGVKPHIIKAKIPGRGLWYRVRVGHYRSLEAATAAKKRFEGEQHVIAYVARR
jgi:cell division protein FtsN